MLRMWCTRRHWLPKTLCRMSDIHLVSTKKTFEVCCLLILVCLEQTYYVLSTNISPLCLEKTPPLCHTRSFHHLSFCCFYKGIPYLWYDLRCDSDEYLFFVITRRIYATWLCNLGWNKNLPDPSWPVFSIMPSLWCTIVRHGAKAWDQL